MRKAWKIQLAGGVIGVAALLTMTPQSLFADTLLCQRKNTNNPKNPTTRVQALKAIEGTSCPKGFLLVSRLISASDVDERAKLAAVAIADQTVSNRIKALPAGEQGPTGPQGLKGDKGATGAAGAQGLQGLKGDAGAAGAQGPQGPKGDRGDQGIAGLQGPQGLKGDIGQQGPQGLKGDKGDAGAAGAQGPQGPKGDRGDQGIAGLQGPQGLKGDVGQQGPQGLKGDKGDAGAAGAQGPQGPKGDQGAVGPSGAIASVQRSVISFSGYSVGTTAGSLNSMTSGNVWFNSSNQVAMVRVPFHAWCPGANEIHFEIFRIFAGGAWALEDWGYFGPNGATWQSQRTHIPIILNSGEGVALQYRVIDGKTGCGLRTPLSAHVNYFKN